MRKWLALVVIGMLLMSGNAFADLSGDTHSAVVYSYQISNPSLSAWLTTAVPITSLVPNIYKIIGYDVQANTTGPSILYAALYDGTSVALSGELVGEVEGANGTITPASLFLFPRQILSGVCVRQGPNTIVTIYFIKV